MSHSRLTLLDTSLLSKQTISILKRRSFTLPAWYNQTLYTSKNRTEDSDSL